MKRRLRVWLLIIKNFRSLARSRQFVAKLEALGYRKQLDNPAYAQSPMLAAVHFRRFGAQEIAQKGRTLRFACNGQSYDYAEDVYLFLNPDVAKQVEEKRLPNGITHFVLQGYDEMLSGKRSAYFTQVAQALIESGIKEAELGRQRIWMTLDGLEYDFIEDLYLKSHPEARVAIRAGHFSSALHHFCLVSMPLIQAGKLKFYDRSYSPEIVSVFEGESKETRRNLCLFAHFDPDGLIDPYVVRYLEGLKTMDCEIVFITGSANEAECKKVAHLCSEFIIRNQYGRDFGSWYLAIKHCRQRLGRYKQVIWANDSVYFPIFPVDKLVDKMERAGFDVWAVHESVQVWPYLPPGVVQYHLQSFFLGFSAKSVMAGILDRFVEWFDKHPILGKVGQIRVFEYWTAAQAIEMNLRAGALCDVESIYDGYIKVNPHGFKIYNTNPTIHMWRQSLVWCHSPTLKIELLREDRFKVFDMDHLAAIIDPKYYDINLIRRHASRLVTGPKPIEPLNKHVRIVERIDRSPLSGTDTLCIFIHYDAAGIIRPYVLRILQALEEVGCEFIFVTGSTKVDEFGKLPESCKRIIRKDPASETTRDMGAYWLGLQDLSAEDLKFRRYILANDSVFFPVADHKRMFAEMEAEDYDLWGAVENLHYIWHIMSYLWVFKKDCFEKAFLPAFVADYRCETAKWELIRLYEMRYPTWLRRLGYKVGAYVTVDKVGQALVKRHVARTPAVPVPEEYLKGKFNVHHDAWDLLISDFNCPALKIEFLRDTNRGARALYELKELLPKYTDYDYKLIADKFGDPQ